MAEKINNILSALNHQIQSPNYKKIVSKAAIYIGQRRQRSYQQQGFPDRNNVDSPPALFQKLFTQET